MKKLRYPVADGAVAVAEPPRAAALKNYVLTFERSALFPHSVTINGVDGDAEYAKRLFLANVEALIKSVEPSRR